MTVRILLAFLLLGAANAMAIEEPAYEVLRTVDEYEVRRYAPYVVAEMDVEGAFSKAGNKAFRPLFEYISGANSGATEIEMTAPVTQRADDGGEKISMTAPVTQRATPEGSYVVQFVLPESYTLDTAPKPEDPRVRLREEPERLVAVHRYSGTWSESRYREREARLLMALERDGLTATGDPVWARFNSPFSLWFLRRNEIWIPVESAQGP